MGHDRERKHRSKVRSGEGGERSSRSNTHRDHQRDRSPTRGSKEEESCGRHGASSGRRDKDRSSRDNYSSAHKSSSHKDSYRETYRGNRRSRSPSNRQRVDRSRSRLRGHEQQHRIPRTPSPNRSSPKKASSVRSRKEGSASSTRDRVSMRATDPPHFPTPSRSKSIEVSEYQLSPSRRNSEYEALPQRRVQIESTLEISYREKKRYISGGTVQSASPYQTVESCLSAYSETLHRLSRFLGGGDSKKLDYHPQSLPYLGPVQVLQFVFENPATNQKYVKTAHGFAFGHQFLFTAKHSVKADDIGEGGQGLALKDIRVVDPRHPNIGTKIVLTVYLESAALDVAVLKCDMAYFHRLELHSPVLRSFETVYHVDYIDKETPALHPGQCYSNVSHGLDIYCCSDAKNDDGFSGGPVVLLNGWVVGMHTSGSTIGSRFVTISGLAMVLVEAEKSTRLNCDVWRMKCIKADDLCKNSSADDSEAEDEDEYAPGMKPLRHAWLDELIDHDYYRRCTPVEGSSQLKSQCRLWEPMPFRNAELVTKWGEKIQR